MSVATAVRLTTEHKPRTERVTHVVLHHQAGTSLSQLENLMAPGGRVVSAHWAVKDGNRIHKVPFDRRAFSLGDAYWDSKAITVETSNESVNGWTISPESHESLAMIVADAAKRFGFRPHREGDPKSWTVIGHREVKTIHGGSYATACPGAMDLDGIAKRAQEILAGEGIIAPTPPPAPAPVPVTPSTPLLKRGSKGDLVRKAQQRLIAHGFSVGRWGADGQFGAATDAAVHAFQKARRLAVDGIVGPETWKALNAAPGRPAAPVTPTSRMPLVLRGSRGEAVRKLQETLKRNYPLYARHLATDGKFGPETEKAVLEFQRRSGLATDGKVGRETWRKLGF